MQWVLPDRSLLKEFQFIKSLKIWWSMAYIFCYATSKFNDFILSTVLYTNDVIDLLPQQLRNYQMFY